jgi:PAS domain S-box-containing protein
MNLNLKTTIPNYPVPAAMLQSICAEASVDSARRALGTRGLLFGSADHLLLSPIDAEAGENCHCDFDALLMNILAGFTNCPRGQVEHEIQTAFRLVCEFLEIERAALWDRAHDVADCFTVRHLYSGHAVHSGRSMAEKCASATAFRAAANSRPLVLGAGSSSNTCFPWISDQVQHGRTVVLWNLGQLPPEAARDREALMRLGVRSCAVIPLLAESKILGAASFALNMDSEAAADALVGRLRFVSQVLGVGLAQASRDKELWSAVHQLSCFKAAFDEHSAVTTTDAQGRIAHVNDRFCAISQYRREEVLGQDHRIINSGHHPKEFFGEMWSTISQGRVWRGDIKNRAKDGSFYWEATTIVPILDEQRQPRQYMSIRANITEQKLAEESLTRSYAEIKQLKDRLEAESAYLQSEIRVNNVHGQIIGHSAGIKRVLHQVEQVAPAECAVLLTGETGTGKELIAQEIHRLSARRERLMVLVNCAALPSALVESELFGRERGAYTGALTAQVGRFQIADGSTIFLDEVGELSMEVQAKLLRVLQQGEFQRLGNPKTHKVNVRVVAATNRDLAEEVRKGRFREDLYYRLKVFPIELPPLRERVHDIPPLVFAFMEEFSTRMGKKITKVPRNAMERLQAHSWPGNIRELRNVIEHSVILTAGDMLKLSMLGDAPIRETESVTLAQAEREHIVKTLESTAWRIKGPHGAARRLDLEPSTLYSRMQKLGIPNRRQKDEMTTGS